MSKIRLSRLLIAQVIAIGVFATALAPAASAFYGEMKNKGTGLCLTSRGGGKGAHVEQWKCDGSANQSWVATTVALGGETIWNFGDRLCINERGGVSYKNNPLIMWPCPTGLVFTFNFYAAGGKLSADGSNFKPSGYCGTSGGHRNLGSTVYEWPCNRSPNQYWTPPPNPGGGEH